MATISITTMPRPPALCAARIFRGEHMRHSARIQSRSSRSATAGVGDRPGLAGPPGFFFFLLACHCRYPMNEPAPTAWHVLTPMQGSAGNESLPLAADYGVTASAVCVPGFPSLCPRNAAIILFCSHRHRVASHPLQTSKPTDGTVADLPVTGNSDHRQQAGCTV